MRLLFPFLVVSITTHSWPSAIFQMALEQPQQYAAAVQAHHAAIAGFGSTFLLMIFLEFIFEEREISWLSWVEGLFARVGRIGSLSTIVALAALVMASFLLPNAVTVLRAGIFGVCTFLAVGAAGKYFERAQSSQADVVAAPGPPAGGRGAPVASVSGRGALLLFIRLEILDASFSFDGVIGAFAISSNILIIMFGLGIGALFVRALTVFLVREGTLNNYVYLEHGAHYAIGALAILLGASVVPSLSGFMTGLPGEIVTGLAGVAIIALAFVLSVLERRRQLRAPAGAEQLPTVGLSTTDSDPAPPSAAGLPALPSPREHTHADVVIPVAEATGAEPTEP
jgi:hypothetical protein